MSVLEPETTPPSAHSNCLDPRQQKADRAPPIVPLWFYTIISTQQTHPPSLQGERRQEDILMDGAIRLFDEKMWKGNGKKEKDLSLF